MEDVDTNEAEAHVTFRTEGSESETLRAKWVVACDGGHSVVKSSLHMEFKGKVRLID